MLKFRYDPHPCVVKFRAGEFDHQFGGLPKHRGATPQGKRVAMHLLLQLDLRDPLAPVKSDDSQLTNLPLYYPLRYSSGGGNVQYSVDSNEEITILSPLHEKEVCDGKEYSFPEQFPQREVSLVTLTYKQYRSIIMSEHGSNHYKDDADRKADYEVAKKIDYQRMIRLRSDITPINGDIRHRCYNPRCKYNSKTSIKAEVFAQFTDSLTDEISIWDTPGKTTYTEIYFALLSCCGTIVTENRIP